MRTLQDLGDVDGKRVLVRVDFNVPLEQAPPPSGPARVADDTRIRAALPTIEELRRRGAKLVLMSHLGRPLDREPDLSLRPVANRLAELCGADVTLAPEVVGQEVQALAENLQPRDILVLENVRYEPGETKNDPALADAMAQLGDAYVDDAFGAAHRAHASVEGVARRIPDRAAGLLMEREVRILTELLSSPQRPLVVVLGGAKVSDKIAVIERFLQVAESILIGGAMCFPFLAAQGHSVGNSLCAPEDQELARDALTAAEPARASITLPRDLVVAERLADDAPPQTIDSVDVPDGMMGLDIGPRTAADYGAAIASAATVFWNGPMGAFELKPFVAGTRAVAEAVAGAPGATIVGGGDSAAALQHFGLADRVTHLSTGGGAALALIEGRSLPGLEVLQ